MRRTLLLVTLRTERIKIMLSNISTIISPVVRAQGRRVVGVGWGGGGGGGGGGAEGAVIRAREPLNFHHGAWNLKKWLPGALILAVLCCRLRRPKKACHFAQNLAFL